MANAEREGSFAAFPYGSHNTGFPVSLCYTPSPSRLCKAQVHWPMLPPEFQPCLRGRRTCCEPRARQIAGLCSLFLTPGCGILGHILPLKRFIGGARAASPNFPPIGRRGQRLNRRIP